MKHGVMIKISDGMLMSFQGDMLHHGTLICQHSISGELCPKESIYGIQFGLSKPTLCAFHQICIDQYIREMNIVPKMIVDKTKKKGENQIVFQRTKNA